MIDTYKYKRRFEKITITYSFINFVLPFNGAVFCIRFCFLFSYEQNSKEAVPFQLSGWCTTRSTMLNSVWPSAPPLISTDLAQRNVFWVRQHTLISGMEHV